MSSRLRAGGDRGGPGCRVDGGGTPMETIILFWYLTCSGGMCDVVPLELTREAVAIVSCESGDGHNYGTYTTHARSRTSDGGLFQFNDATYEWLTGRTHADTDTYANQVDAFRRLWNDGRGWRHWRSSQACWGQWLAINDEGRAVWR
jgi:hypothetical protein